MHVGLQRNKRDNSSKDVHFNDQMSQELNIINSDIMIHMSEK